MQQFALAPHFIPSFLKELYYLCVIFSRNIFCYALLKVLFLMYLAHRTVGYYHNNYNNNSDNNPINQSENSDGDRMDEMDSANAYMEIIKENIEYEHHMKYAQYSEKELYQELYEVICEIVCVKHKTVRIGGDEYPYELVKSKFLKLNSSHLDYVISCMRNTTTKINNIKAYMVTALYNAPSTISHYYQQEVQHDMYGGGWSEKGIV